MKLYAIRKKGTDLYAENNIDFGVRFSPMTQDKLPILASLKESVYRASDDVVKIHYKKTHQMLDIEVVEFELVEVQR